MTHIIVKDGRVAVSGGRVVTSAGGAPCCCGGGGGACADDHDPACLSITLSGVDVQTICEYTTNGGTVSTLTAFGFNRTFRVDQVAPGIYNGFFPALIHRRVTFFGGSSAQTRYCPAIEIYLEGTCVDGAFVISQLDVAPSGCIDDGTYSSGYNWSEALFSLLGAGPFSLNEAIPNSFIGGPGCSLGGVGEAHDYFGGGEIVVTVPQDCTPLNNYAIATHCDGILPPIIVDMDTIPSGVIVQSVVFEEELYRLSEYTSVGSPVAVEWVNEECPGSPADLWPIAQECNGTRTLTFDPATRPADGVTFIVGTVRYRPTTASRQEPPTAGVWSTDPCPPTDACADLILNDPRCSLPQYRDCPQCVGFDVGDPQPEPDFDLQDDGTIPGLGDMVAEAIRTISLNTILPCSACERRKQVLNRFGERAGRAVIRLLRW